MINIGDTIYYKLKDTAPTWYTRALVLGETSRSWLVCGPKDVAWKKDQPARWTKVPKIGTIFVTQKVYELAEWAHKNQYLISRLVERLVDYEALRVIADLIGYQEPPELK